MTMQQTVPSRFIDKKKLEDYLRSKNDCHSVKVTRQLDQYHIEYYSKNSKPLSTVRLCAPLHRIVGKFQ